MQNFAFHEYGDFIIKICVFLAFIIYSCSPIAPASKAMLYHDELCTKAKQTIYMEVIKGESPYF